MQQLSVVILAAGQGKRMVSDLPKVLHPLGGKPLLAHVLSTARRLEAAVCAVVYGHGGAAVKTALAGETGVLWVEQAEQLGTGHAVAQALRADPRSAAVPIVAVTSYAMAGDRERCLASGCDGYIEKPIDPQTFVALVERFVPEAR